MKKTKFSRFFESLIYFILLTIPFISVFARVIYVQSNENAVESYSGSNDYAFTLVDNFHLDNYYTLNTLDLGFVNNGNSGRVIFDDVTNISTSNTTLYNNLSNGSYTQFQIYTSTTNKLIYFYDNVGTSVNYSLLNMTLMFDFRMTGVTTNTNELSFLKGVVFIKSTQLFYYIDNAFDYGIQKTIDDFGVGNINFLNWFGTMFSNNNNLLYINFVNMYLNYALWVSVGYLLYYFLNWFIRFVREILDNLIYKETKN